MKKLFKISSWIVLSPPKRISKIFFMLAGLLTISMFSCNDEKQFMETNEKNIPSAMRKDGDIDKLYNEKTSIQREFSKSLAKSLNQSRMLRDLIKRRALEMFNDDYEILYEMIRDERVENNLSVDDLITKNLTDKKSLNRLDSEYSTLTILVPSLPKESFNASKWNVDTEIPKVAVRLRETNDIPLINSDGSEIILEGKYIPGFPVIVVKENERVISDKNKDFKNLKSKSFDSKRGVKYKFLSDDFDRKSKKNKRIAFGSNLPAKLLTAYDIYKNDDGWQRDYIYYDISPNQDRGSFNYDFKDGLTSFKMTGPSPTAAYNKIADQTGDPNYKTLTFGGSQWTDGFFEFKVTCLVNAKNGVGAELYYSFGANPSDLFGLSYQENTMILPWFGQTVTYYTLIDVNLREMQLSIPILNWDLNEYATTIKISIEEVDIATNTILLQATTVKFANNFSIDGGVLKKIGLKLGGSIETTQTQSYQKTFTEGNDPLGDVTINFADKAIIDQYNFSSGTLNQIREYNSGWFSISVEPIKVQ